MGGDAAEIVGHDPSDFAPTFRRRVERIRDIVLVACADQLGARAIRCHKIEPRPELYMPWERMLVQPSPELADCEDSGTKVIVGSDEFSRVFSRRCQYDVPPSQATQIGLPASVGGEIVAQLARDLNSRGRDGASSGE